jgi:hypothetical protein
MSEQNCKPTNMPTITPEMVQWAEESIKALFNNEMKWLERATPIQETEKA